MPNDERDRLRALQDRLLATPTARRFAQDHGDAAPLWEGGPSTEELRLQIHPRWKSTILNYVTEFESE